VKVNLHFRDLLEATLPCLKSIGGHTSLSGQQWRPNFIVRATVAATRYCLRNSGGHNSLLVRQWILCYICKAPMDDIHFDRSFRIGLLGFLLLKVNIGCAKEVDMKLTKQKIMYKFYCKIKIEIFGAHFIRCLLLRSKKSCRCKKSHVCKSGK